MDSWLFFGLLLYFMDIWYSSWLFGTFFPFWYFATRKIWQPLPPPLQTTTTAAATAENVSTKKNVKKPLSNF
jgi:hypothetical protein